MSLAFFLEDLLHFVLHVVRGWKFSAIVGIAFSERSFSALFLLQMPIQCIVLVINVHLVHFAYNTRAFSALYLEKPSSKASDRCQAKKNVLSTPAFNKLRIQRMKIARLDDFARCSISSRNIPRTHLSRVPSKHS